MGIASCSGLSTVYPQAILNALEIYDNLKETGTVAPKRRPEDFGPGDGPK